MSNTPKNPNLHKRKTTSKTPGEMLRGDLKVKSIPVTVAESSSERLKKPKWIRAKFPGTPEVLRLKKVLRDNRLHTVCEEANCPNLGECFGKGTATFMIMGAICTRRCAFCDVAHGRPLALDSEEPTNMARTIADMGLNYVVITSVDRDDLRDGGAQHFADCINATRDANPNIVIEILTPDFRGRMEKALDILASDLPDVFNHNLETVPELYKGVRPGSDYQHSLTLLKEFKERHHHIDTKSGLMLGLGETMEQVERVMGDMREHKIDCLTFGQYLQPSRHHYPVQRYVTPAEFLHLKELGDRMGFKHTASGPMVRSSYHADLQHEGQF